ncbi:hypothetical protein [Paenisporosarcina cavernae]|uniref:PRTase-CE domain-containing protein n=1 Tax=Paenisporosarcina cavernae TaxID=2320858 RepID=A0A385YWQ9_9BACL|nr:hypothetical protein [Paenisporosarcina cavernae]AYC30337.1 hypothetical protein D3873_10950 [Paenisporosarcina cavernae]
MNSDILIKIEDIFDNKGWNKDSIMYNHFITSLEKLNLDEQFFIINLTEKFTYITITEYENLILKMFEDAFNKGYLRKKIYVIPLLKYSGNFESEMKLVKSSNFVAYLTKSMLFNYQKWKKGKKINVYNFLNEDDIKEINEKNNLVIFIDDYIGSGNTAKQCLEEYISKGLNINNILIMSMCIEDNAKKIFDSMRLNYIHSEIDYYNIRDVLKDSKDDEMSILKNISKKINASDDFAFGYNKTGALISLIRTPNNTIPFFWSTKKGRKAPFPR